MTLFLLLKLLFHHFGYFYVWKFSPSNILKLFSTPINIIYVSKHDFLKQKDVIMMMMLMIIFNCVVECLINENQLGPIFQLRAVPKVFIIEYLRHVASRIWACGKPEFKLSWTMSCALCEICQNTGFLWHVFFV